MRLWAHWIPAKTRIGSVDFESCVITLDQPYAGNLKGTVWDDAWAARTPTRFYIYNSRSFLDQRGEFCMDADSHKLYYRPRHTPIEHQSIIAPTVDRLLSIDGARGVQFEGLTFRVSDGLLEVLPSLALHSNVKGGLVHLGDAQDIVIKCCRLLNSGQNGVIVEGDIAECTIYGNLITQAIVVRNNIIDLDGPDILPPFTVLAGYRRANVAVDAPPIHNHNYTYEKNIVCSSSGAIFQIGGKVDNQTFKRVDNNVYYNPAGRYSFRQMTLDDWHRMGLDTHTRFADPLFLNRKEHDFRFKPDSPAPALGFQEIDTSEIGLKEGFPYEDEGIGR